MKLTKSQLKKLIREELTDLDRAIRKGEGDASDPAAVTSRLKKGGYGLDTLWAEFGGKPPGATPKAAYLANALMRELLKAHGGDVDASYKTATMLISSFKKKKADQSPHMAPSNPAMEGTTTA